MTLTVHQDRESKAGVTSPFVFGVDLDLVCADSYRRMSEIVAAGK